MKAIVSISHPEVTELFIILTTLNNLLTDSLKVFLHGKHDRMAEDEKEIVWSARQEYSPSYYNGDLEKMIVNVSISVCRRSRSIVFNADDIGQNSEEVMVILSSHEFEMTRKNNQWTIQIGYDGRHHEFTIDGAAKYIKKELLKKE